MAALAPRGLRFGIVDPADDAQLRAWYEADARGFHDSAPSDEELVAQAFAAARPDYASRRTTGVWDDTLVDAASPVATVAAWRSPLTLPGGEVDAWAISSVTVAPTHRRRGIARTLLESELRTAAAAGLPVAMLTVSEATLYGRYGFGAAASSAELRILPTRLTWVGAPVPGRVQFVDRLQAMADAPAIFDAVRHAQPGSVGFEGELFTRLFGDETDAADLRRHRFLRYDDADGVPRGLAIFRMEENESDFTDHTLRIRHLASATDDAYSALWRTLLETDLVRTVRAWLRPVDEPLRWLVSNPRAIHTAELRDHLWLRVLDAPAALTARTYAGPGRLLLRVADDSEFAAGTFLLDVAADGSATVTKADADAPDDVSTLDVPVDALGSLLLGGVSAVVLARARRVTEATPGAAALADRLFRTATAPSLDIWF